MGALIDKWAELKMLKVQGERLADIVLSQPETVHAAVPVLAAEAESAPPRIELRDVGFRYSDTEGDVLRGVSLTIEPGESIAIVGPSGCGKTTLIKLMLGILAPAHGEVLIAGRPLEAVGRVDLAFDGGDGDAGRATVRRLGRRQHQLLRSTARHGARRRVRARVASVHDEIAALPMGYYTLIGEMGATLSGDRSSVCCWRARLYKRPRVLFLDEATSALDVDRERQVNQAVRQLRLTRVIVAHRPGDHRQRGSRDRPGRRRGVARPAVGQRIGFGAKAR